MTFNLAYAVHHHRHTHPHAIALACEGGALTYGELAARAAGLAWRLHDAGLSNDRLPRVGILASRSLSAYTAVLGAAWAGAAYVPLGVKLPEQRLLALLSLCELSAIIADQDGARLLSDQVLQAAPPCVFALGSAAVGRAHDKRVTWIDPASLAAPQCPTPAPVKPDDTAYIIFTSGTTGMPKGVMIAAGAARHFIEAMTALLGLQPSDRVLETFEPTFDVSVQNMFCTWEAGASLHVLPASHTMNAVKFTREHALTVWVSVPSMVAMLRQLKALPADALPSLRLTVFGGEQLPKAAVELWKKAVPASAMFNHYGPSEATVCCLSQSIDEPLPLTPGRDVLAIGTPLPDIDAAVLDDAGQPVPDGCPGELAIAGPQLATGYLNAPEITQARFPFLRGKRWYLTGDRAMRDASGAFHHLGRMDNQIKVLGHRVELEEVDAHLRMAAEVDMAGTVAWPAADGAVDGSASGLVGFVGAKAIDEAQILLALRNRLPRYMVPSRIYPLDDMPLNANGKVDRKALAQRLQRLQETDMRRP